MLTTKFEKNLLTDTNELAVVIDDVADLDGLEPGEICAAAQAASDRGLDEASTSSPSCCRPGTRSWPR